MPVDSLWARANPELPDCRARRSRGQRRGRRGLWMDPVFCANCGADGGFILAALVGHVFYLCDACEDKGGGLPFPVVPEALVRGRF